MALSHIIAHHLQRQDPNTATTLSLRDKCWIKNGRIEECFRELKHCVIRRFSKDYGRFSDDHGAHPLSSWLQQYTEEKMTFESFSRKAMEHLKIELDKIQEPLDGFVFFSHEQLEHENVIHIFFVQHNTGQFIDSDVEINESFYLDTSNVCLAAKINITDWQSDDIHRASNSLTLLRWRGEKELTDVFVNFIGFSEKIDVGADTEEFLNIVSDYTKDLPEEIAHHTKKQVVDYCLEQDKMGKPVVINELSAELKENPIVVKESKEEGVSNPLPKLAEFATFVSENKPESKPDLIPDKSKLRQFVRISGRDNNLSMSFSSRCLGDTIVYDPNTDSLTIKDIPSSLKARLAKHFQESK